LAAAHTSHAAPRPLQFVLLSVLLRTDTYPYDGLLTAVCFLVRAGTRLLGLHRSLP
jgi:hypothetical protein